MSLLHCYIYIKTCTIQAVFNKSMTFPPYMVNEFMISHNLSQIVGYIKPCTVKQLVFRIYIIVLIINIVTFQLWRN